MFRPHEYCGLGNILIWLSQLDESIPVSDDLLKGYRGKYLHFKNLNILPDDPKLETYCPPIYINPYTTQHVHPNCINKVEPSNITNVLLNEKKHLLDGVVAGLAIKMGGMVTKEGQIIPKFTDDVAINTFESMIANTPGVFFVACDNIEYKRELKRRFQDKVRILENEMVMTTSKNKVDSPAPYLEFFLLSSCPKIVMTGGPKDMSTFSTFGYMAAIWGQKPIEVVWNGN